MCIVWVSVCSMCIETRIKKKIYILKRIIRGRGRNIQIEIHMSDAEKWQIQFLVLYLCYPRTTSTHYIQWFNTKLLIGWHNLWTQYSCRFGKWLEPTMAISRAFTFTIKNLERFSFLCERHTKWLSSNSISQFRKTITFLSKCFVFLLFAHQKCHGWIFCWYFKQVIDLKSRNVNWHDGNIEVLNHYY